MRLKYAPYAAQNELCGSKFILGVAICGCVFKIRCLMGRAPGSQALTPSLWVGAKKLPRTCGCLSLHRGGILSGMFFFEPQLRNLCGSQFILGVDVLPCGLRSKSSPF
jgi:hypothetical protein